MTPIDATLIALGLSLAANLMLYTQRNTYKPRRDARGRFVKKGN